MRPLVCWDPPLWDGRRGSSPCLSRARCRSHRPLLWSILFAWPLVAGTPVAVHAQELTFSVAISMKEAVEEVGRRFQQTRPGVFLRYNFGSSGELQKQIEAGAPVDLFVSAANRQMDELEKKGVILASSRRTFARNALSAIVPTDSGLGITRPVDLVQPQVQRIVIGNPKTVPAGQYAEESLRGLGLWDALRPKLVLGENVRQALEYVARGEVEVGFVYASDVTARKERVKEAFRPPQTSYTPVTYPVAVVAGSRHVRLGEAFIDLLLGPDGQAALTRLGFQRPTETR
jgi:molybdate transport system substrate-binding protein